MFVPFAASRIPSLACQVSQAPMTSPTQLRDVWFQYHLRAQSGQLCSKRRRPVQTVRIRYVGPNRLVFSSLTSNAERPAVPIADHGSSKSPSSSLPSSPDHASSAHKAGNFFCEISPVTSKQLHHIEPHVSLYNHLPSGCPTQIEWHDRPGWFPTAKLRDTAFGNLGMKPTLECDHLFSDPEIQRLAMPGRQKRTTIAASSHETISNFSFSPSWKTHGQVQQFSASGATVDKRAAMPFANERIC
jgi:hypothetical protein